MKQKTRNRQMVHFRFTPQMNALLGQEANRVRRTKTAVLEIAFAHFMCVKADQRAKMNPQL